MFLSFVVVLVLIGLIPVITKKPFIWFPSLSSWLKALALAFPTWTGAVVFPSLFGWQCLLIAVFAATSQTSLETVGTTALVGLLLLIGSLFWYLLLVGLYSFVLRLLWSEIPQFLHWLKPPKKKQDVFFGWIALTLAVLVGVTPLVTWVLISSDFTVESLLYRQDLDRVVAARMEAISDRVLIMWFVVCAYLYQIRSVCRHAVARRRKAKQLTT